MPPFLWSYSHWGKEKINKVETGNMSESTAERCIPPCRCLRIVMEELRRRETVICSDKLWKSHVDVSPSWCKEEEKQWENVAVSHSLARSRTLSRSHSTPTAWALEKGKRSRRMWKWSVATRILGNWSPLTSNTLQPFELRAACNLLQLTLSH